MKYKVVFRIEARDEALEAAGYIAEQGAPEAAQRWYEGLVEAVRSLEQWPKRFALARENEAFADVELRQVVYKSHRLIFAILGDTVHVLHVRHVAQRSLGHMA